MSFSSRGRALIRSIRDQDRLNTDLHRELGDWVHELARDLRSASRMWRAHRWLAATAILSLALGIGANTAIFSVGDAILVQALPFIDAERLVAIRSTHAAPDGGSPPDGERTAAANLADWQAQARSFEALTGYYWRSVDLTGGSHSERLHGVAATPEFFDVFGARPIIGRAFTSGDKGTAPIVLGRSLWARRFASDAALLGKPLDVNVLNVRRVGPTPLTALGVVTSDVHFPPLTADFQLGVSSLTDTIDFWLPAFVASTGNREERLFEVVGKLRPGVTIAQAQAEMDAITGRLAMSYPASNRGWGARVVPLRQQIVGPAPRAVLFLAIGTGIVLLIACGNVASLLLARGIARQREVAIRAALGASRWRIIRQLLAESALIAMPSAAVGLALTWWSMAVLRPLLPQVPLLQGIAVNGRVLGATLVGALLTTVFTGLIPALRLSRVGGSDVTCLAGRGLSVDRSHHRTLQGLVVAEIALTLMLLIATCLLVASATRLWNVNPGFNADRLLTTTISLPNNKFGWKHNAVFSKQVVDAVASLGSVQRAAVIQGVPMRPGSFWDTFEVENATPQSPDGWPVARLRVVSPGYFVVMQIPMLAGRDFSDDEDAGQTIDGLTPPTLHHVIVNQSLAHHFWPGQDAVGKRLHAGTTKEWTTVIGVVGDVRYAAMDAAPGYDLYYPEALYPQAAITLLVRTRRDPMDSVADVRARIRQIDSEAFITDVRPMRELIADSLAPRRASTILLGVFAGIAVVLTLTGIYGVISQAIAQRRLEIGIRTSLGARPLDLVTMLVGDGMKLATIGCVAGLTTATVLMRTVANLLYGVGPRDPLSFTLACTGILVLVAIASYVPARQAAHIDPAATLRSE